MLWSCKSQMGHRDLCFYLGKGRPNVSGKLKPITYTEMQIDRQINRQIAGHKYRHKQDS